MSPTKLSPKQTVQFASKLQMPKCKFIEPEQNKFIAGDKRTEEWKKVSKHRKSNFELS